MRQFLTKYVLNGNKFRHEEVIMIIALLSIVPMLMTFNFTITLKTMWEDHKNAQIVDTCRIKYFIIENHEKTYICRRNSNLNKYISFNENKTKTENLYIERKMKILKDGSIE